jgi:parvulin-like peptidyl-prolyl isomerase
VACEDKAAYVPLVAKVAGREISREEFRVQAVFMGLGSDLAHFDQKLRQAVLESLVQRHLILAQAKSRQIRLEPEELEREERALRGGMGQDVFGQSLSAQGLEYSQWRQVLAETLLARKTLDLILAAKSQVSADEVRDYYAKHQEDFRHPAQIKAQHVVLPSLDLAQQLLKRVTSGEDLGVVAAELGVTLDNFGEPAWLSQGHMPEKLEAKIFALKPGALAGPYKSAYGFHVLRVLDKRPEGTISLAQAVSAIQRILSEKKKQILAENWLKELRDQSEVWLNNSFLTGEDKQRSGRLE